MGVPCLPLSGGFCLLRLGVLLLLASLGRASEAIYAGLPLGHYPRIIEGVGGVVTALLVGAFALFVGNRRYVWMRGQFGRMEKDAAETAARVPDWELALQEWRRLNYCSRCDGVFRPGGELR